MILVCHCRTDFCVVLLGYIFVFTYIISYNKLIGCSFFVFQCAKVSMPILTLARFILEFSLMDYATIQLSDSKLACAALFIALRMNKLKGWNTTLEYYSGTVISVYMLNVS